MAAGDFLAPALEGAERPEDVVEAHHVGPQAVILQVVAAEPLGHQLGPAVAVLGVRRVGVALAQRRDPRGVLHVPGIDAG